MGIMHGEKSHLVMFDEATWGTTPASPSYYHVPVISYGVTEKRDRRNANPFVGSRQRKHGRSYRGMPSGGLSCELYGWKPGAASLSLAEYLLSWAFGQPEVVELASKGADWAEGPNVANVRHNGLRVNSATLEGSADSGAVMLNLDLMGKTEAALVTAQTLPNDREKLVEVLFQDCTFQLGGVTVTPRSFRYQLANNMAATYLNTTSPSYIAAGQRVESLNLQFLKTDDVYSAYNRAFTEQEMTGQIKLKGLHNGTGTGGTNYTVVTIDFARLAFVNPDDSRSISALLEQGLNFDVLKPDTSSDAITITVTEEA